MGNLINKQQFIELTVKEQSHVAIRITSASEFIRGISRDMNGSYLLIETEDGFIKQVSLADIDDIFAVKKGAGIPLSPQ